MSDSTFIDPHIEFKERDVKLNLNFREGYPMFSLVELNIWGDCNRRCEFCPISNPHVFTTRKEGLSLAKYEQLLGQLEEIQFSGVILWSMFSEPTLNKEIFKFAELTKSMLPDVSLQMTSNGDWIKKKADRIRKLLDTGVDRINLSLYDGPQQFAEFSEIIRSSNIDPSKIKLRRRFEQDGNIGITISNRTGLIDSSSFKKSETPHRANEFPLKKPCYYPFYQVSIDFDGDVLLCPHDWGKKYVAGNVFETSIWEIWTSQKFTTARSFLLKSDRSLSACRACDVAGDLIGSAHFQEFASR